MQTKTIAALVALVLVLGIAIGVGGALLIDHHSSTRWITLPRAYSITTGTWHSVDPLDCKPDDPGYSGGAVCSWVRNP